MRLNRFLQLLVLVLGASAVHAIAQDKKAPDEKMMMEKMQQAATPGAAHRKLDSLAGKFTVKAKNYMDPSGQVHESTGTAQRTWLMGNRFLEERFQGEHRGEPFTGTGVMGYDNVTRQYIGTWYDSMSTGITTLKGTMSGDTIKYKGLMSDPIAGKEVPYTMSFKIVNKDTQTMEFWGAGPNGKQMKWMEMTYTRAK